MTQREADMLTIKDIMTESVISVKKDTPIDDALELLVKHRIAGLPVVEDDMTLVGILSEKDVLKLLHSTKGEEARKTVESFMAQLPVHFDENESLLDVCDCLINNPFCRVPITSKGRLVGVISRADIIECILYLRDESAKDSSVKQG